MIAESKSLYYFSLRSGQSSRDHSIYSILCSFFFPHCEFWHLFIAAFLLWTLEAANSQDFNKCPLSRLSLCLSCPALGHVCSHTSAQFSQWSCAKFTHLCWTKQHIGLQASQSPGVIHPKYSSLERCGPARGFWVKIVKKASGTKINIYPSVLVWNEKLTAPCKNESLDFSFTSFLKHCEIFVTRCLLRFCRSYTQSNKRGIFITLSHNWNVFSSCDLSP